MGTALGYSQLCSLDLVNCFNCICVYPHYTKLTSSSVSSHHKAITTSTMRFATISTIAAFAATAMAQLPGNIPSCGASCVGNGLAGTGCNTIDVACICNSASWISELSCCVSQNCEPADQQTIIEFAQGISQPVGVTNLPTSAGCSGSATASATGSSTGGALSSAAATASTFEQRIRRRLFSSIGSKLCCG